LLHHAPIEMVQRPSVKRILSGAVVGASWGFVATIPMTAFMVAAHRVLPHWQRYALPPEQITSELASRSKLDDHLDKRRLLAAALTSHFCYGSAMGAIYRLLRRTVPESPATGVSFGLLIWAVSYLGWLPAADILPPPPDEPRRRVGLMILAHAVYGASLETVAMLVDGRTGHPKRSGNRSVNGSAT
jgi:uncharacterized membrane protein YagU involved in acid resistance